VTPNKYDVIVSEPSHPWVPGVANLFTKDFFEMGRERLSDEGVFVQWVQIYQLSTDSLRSVLGTYQKVFPHVLMFRVAGKGKDLILLGSNHPLNFDHLEGRLKDPRISADIARVNLHNSGDIMEWFVCDELLLAPALSGAEINTDDNMLVENRVPREAFKPSMESNGAWIDAFAAGIGDRKVVVILEPDGLGIIPFHTDLAGKEEWCKPPDADKVTAAKERYELVGYAVDKLRANPRSAVYLDGTHSAWLSVGDIANRLVKAGVQRASGFFINASNYEPGDKLLDYGTWVSQCIQYGTHGDGTGHFDRCASQYYPASPNDYATWAKSRKWYADNVGKAAGPLTHFVIDTSRNGRGSWAPKAGNTYKDAQT